ncbi:MAG: hypothetical protein ACN6OB_12325 [Chryseobacterium jejuense]|uniref:hypothetical protein n=1 Tax=Chryseobacterium jejuense TaxID=445960 RepID=UPI003D09EBC8
MSVAADTFESLHYTDSNDTNLYPYLSDTSSQELVSPLGYSVYYHTRSIDDFQYIAFENSLQSNVPMVNDRDSFLLPMKDLKSISVLNKWRIINFAGHTDVLDIIKQVKRFYVNSVKLIDGFKFIIKIPDKLMSISIK